MRATQWRRHSRTVVNSVSSFPQVWFPLGAKNGLLVTLNGSVRDLSHLSHSSSLDQKQLPAVDKIYKYWMYRWCVCVSVRCVTILGSNLPGGSIAHQLSLTGLNFFLPCASLYLLSSFYQIFCFFGCLKFYLLCSSLIFYLCLAHCHI